MKLYGIQKTSLVDYPGHICATLFTKGCNMRCSFCHNPDLVLPSRKLDAIDEDEIIEFLQKRKGLLEGVCITGGEPTLHTELPLFIKKIKALGYLIKLDTNGTNPKMVKSLIDDNLIDFVAMDVKASVANYHTVCKLPKGLMANVLETINLLKMNFIPYEFRTTIVRGMHDKNDLYNLCQLIKGCPRYTLQKSLNSNALEPELRSVANFTDTEMETFTSYVRKELDCDVCWK